MIVPPPPGDGRPRIAASVLSADFGALGDAAIRAKEGGADWLHLDVMDGHFVPNLSFGPPMVAALHGRTGMFCDVHLMVEAPERLLEAYVAAGAGSVTVHAEATCHLHRTLGWIRSLGVRAGVAINPATPLEAMEWALQQADMLLVMTVNPGFGGQEFIESMVRKVEAARRLIDGAGVSTLLEVDGGIDPRTVRPVVEAGAEVLVVGSALYKDPDGVGSAVSRLRRAIAER